MEVKHTKHIDDRPIAVYNTYKKELIGLFAMSVCAGKYIFNKATNHKKAIICNALRQKYKIHNTIFPFPLAIRSLSVAQSELLGDNLYLILNGYPIPHYKTMKGFDSTKETMRVEGNEHIQRYNTEMRNKRNRIKAMGNIITT